MRSAIVLGGIGVICWLLFAVAPSPVRANCYEIIGCSDSQYFKSSDLQQLGCQPLWEVRNWIYKERGYCFKTPNTNNLWWNVGADYDHITQVPLNQFEKYNVKAIKKAEAKKGC